jgi:predicted component of type VI protein secretion system
MPPSDVHRRGSDPLSDTTDSQKLFEINQQMKATLTELLNTDSVRADDKYRAWIQERLMDAEHQIRRQRRRRSSSDREMAESIHEHFEHTTPRYSV